jgi:hypothetical protein
MRLLISILFAALAISTNAQNSIYIKRGSKVYVKGDTVTIPVVGGEGLDIVFATPSTQTVSAGVYTTNNVLIRGIFNNVVYPAGTHTYTWDGTDDDYADIAAGTYKIKVLRNNVTYTWEGVIGNTSKSFTGDLIHKGFLPIASMCFSSTKGYYSVHYNERSTSQKSFLLSEKQEMLNVLPDRENGVSQSTEFSCTDGTRVYWAGDKENASTWVFATSTADNTEVAFSSGSSYQGYNNAIAVGGSVYGMAVGTNFLYVSRSAGVEVYNKTTGALIRTQSFENARHLARDDADALWVTLGNTTVTKYTIDGSGNFTASGISLTGFTKVGGVGSQGSVIGVLDASTVQQAKLYNTSTGAPTITVGTAGGYLTSPAVTNYKFSFDNSYIAFQSDGSFWIGDKNSYRNMHYNSAGTYIDQIAYIPHSYYSSIDPNNPSRIYSDHLEFERDYNVTLSGSTGWLLKRNFIGSIDANNLSFQNPITFSNGRAYGLMYNTQGGANWRVMEVMPTALLRYTGITFGIGSNELYADGSIRYIYSFRSTNEPLVWYKKALTGFDGSNNPIWASSFTALASTPNIGEDDPAYMGVGGTLAPGEQTTSGLMVVFDGAMPGSQTPSQNGSEKYHLGAVELGASTWKWRTSLPTFPYYRGRFPSNGDFDIGNGEAQYGGGPAYAGSVARVQGRSIFWGYHGEFWKGGQCNMWQHVWDNGLMVGQFGAQDGGASGAAGMAGNSFCAKMATIGSNYYLVHNDESVHGGVHSWKISGLNTVVESETTITLVQPYDAVPVDPTDMMNGLDYNTVLVSGDGGWYRSRAEETDAVNGRFWNIKTYNMKYLRRETGDLYVNYKQTVPGSEDQVYKDFPTYIAGRNSWTVSSVINLEYCFPDAFEGGTYLEVLDNADRVIARFNHTISFGGTNPRNVYGNGNLIHSEGGLPFISNVLWRNQPLTISATSAGVRFAYADYTPIVVPVSDPLANWQNPKRVRVKMFGVNYDRKINILSLHFQ